MRLGCAMVTAEFLRLFDSRLQLAPAAVEMPFQGTCPGTGIDFRQAKLLAARLFPIRAGALPLQQRQQVARPVLRPEHGRKTYPPVDLDRHQVWGNISVENRHAPDDSAWLSVLPVRLAGHRFGRNHDPFSDSPRPDGTFTIADRRIRGSRRHVQPWHARIALKSGYDMLPQIGGCSWT